MIINWAFSSCASLQITSPGLLFSSLYNLNFSYNEHTEYTFSKFLSSLIIPHFTKYGPPPSGSYFLTPLLDLFRTSFGILWYLEKCFGTYSISLPALPKSVSHWIHKTDHFCHCWYSAQSYTHCPWRGNPFWICGWKALNWRYKNLYLLIFCNS